VAYETIRCQVEDQILTITLDRPERMNAFAARMVRELIDAFDRADADDEVRVVIMTGAGRAFCAGADLDRGGDTFKREGATGGAGDRDRDGGGMVALRIYDSLKPVIAAFNGAAVGVGVTMTLPMDIRLTLRPSKDMPAFFPWWDERKFS
jgi:enoyl-CoA hydratase/carnithine racemase